MRILMTLFNQTGRGTYWRALGFARVLARKGHSVTLMCTSPKAHFRVRQREVDGVHLVETPDLLPGSLRSGWDLYNLLSRLAWLRGRQFDIVHSFETRPVNLWPALSAKRNGAHLFLDWCDYFGAGGSVEMRPDPLVRAALRPVETYFENHFRSTGCGTTVINSFLLHRAVELGVKEDQLCLLRNGSDISLQPLEPGEARRSLGLPVEGRLIGFVGGTYPPDARFMAEAFDHLLQKEPTARLLLVGYFNRPIETWISPPAAVIRTGSLDYHQMHTYLSACDLCWLPLCDTGANRGRWPYKLNDYMTASRAVVSTSVGDLADFIPQYGIGIVTPSDPVQFARATLELLADEPRRHALGQAARTLAETTFNWEKLTDQLENFYSSRIASDGNSRLR